ncbi:hypothetical protein PAXINDRAFT_164891, partial [Paxillus involutus ATCC 200175]
MPTYTLAQVAEHKTPASCWVIISSKVYDVTDFYFDHPGGPQVILDLAGQDATAAYVPIHPSDVLDKNIPPEKHLGELDEASIRELSQAKNNKVKTKDELRVEEARQSRPPLSRIINVRDMEETAKKLLPHKAMAYYASAADDSMTHIENARAFSRFFFHPRVMRAVSGCDTLTTMLGHKTSIPIYISSAALARWGHPLGEINLTRGAYKTGVIQIVSTYASVAYGQIASARGSPEQPIFFQLYKLKNEGATARRIREVEALGYKAIVLTVDSLTPPNRELDTRAPHYPLGDAVLAAEAGCEGIVLSNHGGKLLVQEHGVTHVKTRYTGRQLDYSLPPVEVLYKLRKERPDVFVKTEVYIDGGIRRGTDVLKALCLGAKTVGLGRAFLYAQSAYGEAGVVHLVRMLQREIKFGMESPGVRSIDQLLPEMVERVDWQPVVAPKL